MLVTIGKFEGITSPLDLIRRVMESAEYVAITSDENPRGIERIIGEMNDEEKACYTAREMILDTLRLIHDGIRLRKDDAELRSQFEALKEYYQIIGKLFWMTLEMRFREVLEAPDVTGIGVRPGYRVAAFFEDTSPEDMLVEALLGALAKAHNCATCEKYDQCDLPAKKSSDQIAAERTAAAGRLN